jgi:hypothetical protein
MGGRAEAGMSSIADAGVVTVSDTASLFAFFSVGELGFHRMGLLDRFRGLRGFFVRSWTIRTTSFRLNNG